MKNNILLIDDDKFICKSLQENLQKVGFKVLTSENGFQALEILSSKNIDLIISDIKMPHMSGLELLSKVKKQWSQIPFILITGYAENEFILKAMDLGVKKFLKKPIDISMFINAVQVALIDSTETNAISTISGYVNESAEIILDDNFESIKPAIYYLSENLLNLNNFNFQTIHIIRSFLYSFINTLNINQNRIKSIQTQFLSNRILYKFKLENININVDDLITKLDSYKTNITESKTSFFVNNFVFELTINKDDNSLNITKFHTKNDKAINQSNIIKNDFIFDFNQNENICLVTDNIYKFKELSKSLKDEGCKIHYLMTQNIKNINISAFKPSIILVEFMKNEKDNYEIKRTIEELFKNIPVIFITDSFEFDSAIWACNENSGYYSIQTSKLERLINNINSCRKTNYYKDKFSKNISFSTKISIPNNPEFLTSASYYLSYILYNRINVLKDVSYNFILSFNELLSNAYEHGNKKDENKKIIIKLNINNKIIQAEISDEGDGFDHIELNMHKKIDPSNITGRGFYVINQLIDSIEFNNKGNSVIIKKVV